MKRTPILKDKKKPEPKLVNKRVQDALDRIAKAHGPEAIKRLGDHPPKQHETVSSGSIGLDLALGHGGYARGRIIEIFGPESTGKTTLALHAVAEVQRKGGVAAYIDAENSLDVEYAKRIGVDVDDLLLSQPDAGEQALQIVETLIESAAADIVVVDSVAALVPQVEIDGEMGDQHVGLQARMMSQALRKLAALVNKSNTILLFINQTRIKIGGYGNPEITSGGNALKFYATYRIHLKPQDAIKVGEKRVGQNIRARVVKNKVFPPFRETILEVMYGRGVCPYAETLQFGEQLGVVEKSGTWFSFGEDRLGQGRDAALTFLMENADIYAKLREAVIGALGVDA